MEEDTDRVGEEDGQGSRHATRGGAREEGLCSIKLESRCVSYDGDLGEEYWDKWVKNPYREEKGSFIKHEELKNVVEEMEYKEVRKLEEIVVRLERGATLGVEGEGKWPSEERNNSNVYDYG